MQLHFPYLTQDVPDKEPAAEKEMSGDTLPVQYVANIKDGTMTGYKSFSFYNLQKITLKLRGKAKGTIAVFTEDLTKPAGTLNVDIAADTWQDITGMVSVSNGPHDLYFRYEGEGALDFITFTPVSYTHLIDTALPQYISVEDSYQEIVRQYILHSKKFENHAVSYSILYRQIYKEIM